MRYDDALAMDYEELHDMMHGRSLCDREMCDAQRSNHREVCRLPRGHKGDHVYEPKSHGGW